MDQLRTFLAEAKDSEPEQFCFLSTSADISQIRKMSKTFSADDFRSDMAAKGMPVSEIEEKLAHARANPR
jgi:hypothetical protein